MKWEEVTSYSKVDKSRVPSSWQLKLRNITITVHRHIHCEPNEWLISCGNFYNCKMLKSKDLEQAKIEAISMILDSINDIKTELDNVWMIIIDKDK